MKKLLKISGITIAAIIVLLMVLPLALKGKVETIIKEEGNKMLNAQFDFESLDISLLSQFPQASVTLENFWLKGIGEFEKTVDEENITNTVFSRLHFNLS